MIRQIPLDSEVPDFVLRDVERMIASFKTKRQSVRVVRLHVEDYQKLLEKVGGPLFTAWTPTLCGVPVEPWEKAEVGVFAVADDNTPLSASGGTVREEIG
jgi:hypothetical protein